MSRLIKILFWLLVSANSCCRPTDIYSSFDLERNELLKRMRIIERMYVWNNFKTVVEYPELISENVFERLPNEWRELKRVIRRNQFDDAYRIIKKEAAVHCPLDIWRQDLNFMRLPAHFICITRILKRLVGVIVSLVGNYGL